MSKEQEPQDSRDSLFPDKFPNTPKLSPEEIRTEATEAARKIAEAADAKGPVEYEDRTSEAARDQGRGVIDISTIPEEKRGDRQAARNRGTHPSMRTGRPARPIRESRYGDSERDTGNPDYHQPPAEPLSPEEKATIEERLPEAREAITAGPDPDDEAMKPAHTGPVRTPEEIEAGRAAIEDIRNNVLPFNRSKP